MVAGSLRLPKFQEPYAMAAIVRKPFLGSKLWLCVSSLIALNTARHPENFRKFSLSLHEPMGSS